MKVKKIAALAVGAAMVGATIGFASAQPSVPNIPKEFFVKDGQPNVKIVVGSQGAAQDVAGAADIAVAIGSLLYTEKDVSIEDASVVVKKDVAYDPDDIPVFCNFYKADYNFKEKPDITKLKDWWNGAYDDDGDPVFNVTLKDSVWDNGIYDKGWDIKVKKAVEWIDGNNNNTWTDPNEKTHYLTDVKIHYDVHIGKVILKELNEGDVDKTDIDDFSDFTLVVDDVVANVTFKLNAYSKTIKDKVLGDIGVTYTVSDLQPSSKYKLYEKGVISGVEKDDTIKLFGKTIKVLDIGKDDKGKPYIEYGKDWGKTYIDAGASKTFGDYTVKVLDIDVQKEKALLEVSGPKGSETITLKTLDEGGKPVTLFDGGIRITLLDTFIGISGTNSVKVSVQTDIKHIREGDEFIPGWVVHLGVNGTKLDWFALTNKDKLKGKEIKLFDTYVMDYKADILKKTKDDKTYAAMEAWVVIDPLKPEYTTKTLEVGDELDDWIVDKIEATPNPAKAAVPGEVKPVTVLDTEIMAEGLDKVDSNLILVGGPVVNKVTAALAEELGIPANYTGWKEKFGTGKESGVVKYLAKCAAINDHGVVLVAGTDREGTKAAAETLMEYIASLS